MSKPNHKALFIETIERLGGNIDISRDGNDALVVDAIAGSVWVVQTQEPDEAESDFWDSALFYLEERMAQEGIE